jgi:hypothetical protein
VKRLAQNDEWNGAWWPQDATETYGHENEHKHDSPQTPEKGGRLGESLHEE